MRVYTAAGLLIGVLIFGQVVGCVDGLTSSERAASGTGSPGRHCWGPHRLQPSRLHRLGRTLWRRYIDPLHE